MVEQINEVVKARMTKEMAAVPKDDRSFIEGSPLHMPYEAPLHMPYITHVPHMTNGPPSYAIYVGVPSVWVENGRGGALHQPVCSIYIGVVCVRVRILCVQLHLMVNETDICYIS